MMAEGARRFRDPPVRRIACRRVACSPTTQVRRLPGLTGDMLSASTPVGGTARRLLGGCQASSEASHRNDTW